MKSQKLCAIALLIASQTAIVNASAAETRKISPQISSTKIEQRKLQFPSDYSVGSLQMMHDEGDTTGTNSRGVGTAQGNVTISVPSEYSVLLDLNPRCIEHPELIKNLHTAGINRLKLSYLSMDDVDHSFCDKALQALPEFKDLIVVNVERSDVTDKGLAAFKSLSHVRGLTAFACAFDGSIFKETQKLKNLQRVDLMFNPLKGVNFKTLNELPRLQELNLNQTNISDDDLKYLPRCSQLKALLLLDNRRITDRSLPVLKLQTSLEVLDVRGTSLTVSGLASLKGLPLKLLILSIRRYQKNELEALTRAFPKATLNYRGSGVTKEDQTLYAPMK